MDVEDLDAFVRMQELFSVQGLSRFMWSLALSTLRFFYTLDL